jgi:hypothetical protein
MRVARNRYVLRAHERLLRDANRLKEDDRTRRMEALKVSSPSPQGRIAERGYFKKM